MSPLDAIRRTLQDDRDHLRDAVKRVPTALRGVRPAPDRWSVAEVLEHLSIVESRSIGALTPLVAGAPMLSGGDNIPARTFDRSRLRDRTERVPAPEGIQPTGTLDADAAWAALERSRQQLFALLDSAGGRDLARISRMHPRLGELDGYQWIAAIGAHEERHALQILEIAAELAAQDPASASGAAL